jgi:hypothetical protein
MQIPMSKNNEHSHINNYEKLNAYNSENLNAQWSEDPNAKATNTKFNQYRNRESIRIKVNANYNGSF